MMSENGFRKSALPKNGTMSLMDHLGELRVRIIRFLLVLGVFVVCCYFYRKEILDLIKKPVEKPLQKYTALSRIETGEERRTSIPSRFYQCACENMATAAPAESEGIGLLTTKNGRQTGGDGTAKKGDAETANGFREKGSSGWWERAEDALFDFVAYFQFLLGREPTASPQYEKRDSPSAEAVSETATLNLNCRCQLRSDDGGAGRDPHSSMVYIGLPELFFAQMKAAVFAGFFLAFPYLLIEIWGFVGPALYRAERKIFWIFAFTSYICFIGGSLFGYMVVFPFGFDFFLSLTQPGEIMPSLSVGDYLNLSIKLLLAFGFIFEMPLLTFILARLGIVTPGLMFRQSRIIVLIIFLLSALLTPPDPFTMVLMAGPLIVLYLISIVVCFFGVNRQKAALRRHGLKGDEF